VDEIQAGEGGEGAGSADALSDLSAIPMFRDLDPATLRAVRDKLQWLTLPGSSALFREDKKTDFFYDRHSKE
jgi:hypothetical protein